jgi:hypothetical protein
MSSAAHSVAKTHRLIGPPDEMHDMEHRMAVIMPPPSLGREVIMRHRERYAAPNPGMKNKEYRFCP